MEEDKFEITCGHSDCNKTMIPVSAENNNERKMCTKCQHMIEINQGFLKCDEPFKHNTPYVMCETCANQQVL